MSNLCVVAFVDFATAVESKIPHLIQFLFATADKLHHKEDLNGFKKPVSMIPRFLYFSRRELSQVASFYDLCSFFSAAKEATTTPILL